MMWVGSGAGGGGVVVRWRLHGKSMSVLGILSEGGGGMRGGDGRTEREGGREREEEREGKKGR